MEFIETKKITNNIAKITLTNGKKYNPLSLNVLRHLNSKFNDLSNDSNVKVIIISSNGPGFSAGHDLQELKQNKNNKEFFTELFNECSNLMLKIMKSPQPVIAQIPGVAAAAGCQLVATCDLAIASNEAVFITPGVNIGLFCSTPMVAVSRSLGRKKTMEMLLTGESMNAEDAVSFGLINKNVPLNELEITVLNFAKLIASKPTSTVRIGKEAFYKQVELPIEKAYKYTSEVMAQNMLKKDAKEGIEAFLEKREPKWEN
ncbi:enoyl-CoA hydratase [Alphaproteobacteria bacterium]|nr:enoyl-CoA hydratase [Alphaproteobacteria bacterium]